MWSNLNTHMECMCMCVCGQSCSTLCNPMDSYPPGSFVHQIFQARIPEWVAISTPEDLPGPGVEPASRVSPALADRFFSTAPLIWRFTTKMESVVTLNGARNFQMVLSS